MKAKLIVPLLLALTLSCGAGSTGPDNADYYIGRYHAVEVNGFPTAGLVDFNVSFYKPLTCALDIQWEGGDRADATCTYTEPDAAHDSRAQLDPPYEDESYPLHWTATGDTLYLRVNTTTWIMEKQGSQT